MKFKVREEAFRISGVDLTQIDGINESAALWTDFRDRHQHESLADRKTFRIMANAMPQ